MFCKKCGKNLPEGTKFCSGCGERTKAEVQADPKARSSQPPTPVSQANYVSQEGGNVLSVGDYIKMLLLMFIPIANFVLLFIWAFGSQTNINKKNFAKASLIIAAISFVIWILFAGLFMGLLNKAMYY